VDIQKIPASQIKAAKYNPRKDLKPGDPEYDKLRRSIEEFGYVEPVIWNKRTGNIVGGHQRYKVLIALGVKEIDCVVVDLDKAAAEIDIPVTRRGDVWLLGKHRLMCGDSASMGDVSMLMGGKKARFVFADPPWNVDCGADSKHPSWKPRTILNDKMSTEEFGAFLMAAFQAMKEVSEPGCMTYVVMSGQEWGNLMNAMRELNYHSNRALM